LRGWIFCGQLLLSVSGSPIQELSLENGCGEPKKTVKKVKKGIDIR
jgi:hypothetical protein